MKYAIVNGKRTNIKDADRGDLGYDCWFRDYQVKACKGHYMQYWRYLDDKPILPDGYENETPWHVAWKSSLKDEYVEVISGENNEHRADIMTPDRVIEIQYSSISYDSACERSDFYKALTGSRLIWIVNVYGAAVNKRITTRPNRDNPYILNVEWKYPKKWAVDLSEFDNNDVYLDMSKRPDASLLKIWKHNNRLYGKWITRERFFNECLSRYSNQCFSDFAEAFTHLNIKDYL